MAKVLGVELRQISLIQLIVLLFLAIVFLFGSIRWGLHLKSQDRVNQQYLLASGGDLESVKQLERQQSWGRLRELALDKRAFADGRVEAIRALARKNTLSDLSPLLSVLEPALVRHAAAEVFEQRGCDHACIAEALQAQNDLFAGRATIEMVLASRYPQYADEGIMSQLRAESEKDSLTLLNSDPCLTMEILNGSFKADPNFVNNLKTKLKPCG